MNDIYFELTSEQIELIKKYAKFYRSLDTGEHLPATFEQLHFVEVCHGRANATSSHEIAWMRHKMNLEVTQQVADYQKQYESNHFVTTEGSSDQYRTCSTDEDIRDVMEDEINEKLKFADSNACRAYIDSTF